MEQSAPQPSNASIPLTIEARQKAYAEDYYDVIVVGAGSAGMPLAIAAAERGGKVLVIEKSGQVGGTLHYSGGHVAAAGTRVQARLGINDSPDLHYDDIMHLSHNLADPAITRRFVDNAAIVMDWLDDLGFECREGEPVKGADHSSFSVERYYQGPEFGVSLLKAMTPPFQAAVASSAVKLLLRTGAVELVQAADQSITGVIAENLDGVRTQYNGRNVVLTSGGYCSSPRMFKALTGHPLYGRGAYAFSQGKGIEMGIAAGGYVHGGEYQRFFYGITVEDEAYPAPMFAVLGLYPNHRLLWEILVNKHGQRFMAEDEDIDIREVAFSKQPGAHAWVLFDQAIKDQAPSLVMEKTPEEIEKAFVLHPMFASAGTIEELAVKLGLPPTETAATVAKYNAGVAAKTDEFGRKFLPLPIVKPPFYSVEAVGTSIVGFAGLKIDSDCRVLRKDGSPIPNLYAAGEVTGLATTAGDTFVGGAALTPALTFGRMLGQEILPFG